MRRDDPQAVEPELWLPADWDWRAPQYDAVWERRLAAMRRIRETPGGWDALKEIYRNDWPLFVHDWFCTFDPRNVERGLPAKTPFLLFQKQTDFLVWVHRQWTSGQDGLCEKSRNSGATWLCVGAAICMWLFIPGATVGFGSRKETNIDLLGDPNSIFWKLRAAVANLPVELRPKGWNEKKHAPYMRLLNPENGNSIVGEAGDQIGRGARTSIYFVDEAAYLERPELIDAALSETTNCRIDVSTPNGVGNTFYKRRMSGRVPVFTFHWSEDPRKGPEWYAKKVASLDPVVLAQEVEINYEASVSNVLIDPGLVDKAMATPKSAVSIEGPRVITVDVARFGDNETVITLWKGRAVIWQKTYRRMDTVMTSGHVRAVVEGLDEVPQIHVDDIGVGGGVTDQLRQWYGEKVKAINAASRVDDGLNFNLRSKMYSDLRDWLADGPCSIPFDPTLKVQLNSITYSFQSGLRRLPSKDELAKVQLKGGSKSPDRADSLALRFGAPLDLPEEAMPHIPAPRAFDPSCAF